MGLAHPEDRRVTSPPKSSSSIVKLRVDAPVEGLLSCQKVRLIGFLSPFWRLISFQTPTFRALLLTARE